MPGDRCAEPAGFLQWANPWRMVDRAKALSCRIPEQIKSISELEDKKKYAQQSVRALEAKELCSYSLVSSIPYWLLPLPHETWCLGNRPGATWIPSWSSTVIGIGLDASAKLEYISKCISIFNGSEITLVVLSRNEKSITTIRATRFMPCTSPTTCVIFQWLLTGDWTSKCNQSTSSIAHRANHKGDIKICNESIRTRTVIGFLGIYHQW